MKNPSTRYTQQRGQAIVLIAIIMVALVASLGLAIDGGGMYLLYRDAQNAVDAAALSAAFALCTDADPEEVALQSLALNGFDSTRPGVTIAVNHPPVVNTTYAGDTSKIEIILNAEKQSYFIQVVYPGPLAVDVDVISNCTSSTGGVASSVAEQYAFRSLAGPGECTQTTSWNVAGTRWTVEGDIWMPNISGSPQFNNNQPNPENRDDPIDILGNIYIGGSPTDRFNDSHTANGSGLNEDYAGSPAGDSVPGYTGYGGDGVIEYNVPEPPPLPYTMDYFRPAGSPLCTTAECGALQSQYPAQYHDISAWCHSGGQGITYQDFGQNGVAFGGYYDDAANEWEPGIYYSDCDINLNDSNMRGNVTWISEEDIDLSNQPYYFTAFGDAPVMVSNEDNSRGNPDQCSAGGGYAIQINANNSYFQGEIIAFRGTILIQGNDFLLESCISARGFAQNGNTRAVYRCLPGEGPVQSEIGIVE